MSTERTRTVPRWARWTAAGVFTAVVLAFGAVVFYAKVLNDSPDEFTPEDIDVALSAAASTSTDAPVTIDTTSPVATSTTTVVATTGAPTTTTAPATTTWTATAASEVGYRVDEVLFGVTTTAVGRTHQVTGSLTIDGTLLTTTEFVVDVVSITSDDGRREERFRGQIMSSDQFPTATFALTAPVELGTAPTEGAEVTASATGALTLRGVTRTVTFDVTAKQANGLIGVQGAIDIAFADYGIANPSVAGAITTEDHGLVEFVLVFSPA